MVFPSTAFCWDKPFNNASNWGGTGLMEVPSARVLGEGEIRFGYAQADPYRWYAGGLGVFSWLEVSGRYTEVKNIPSGLGSGFGALKDKAVDLKLQILPESKRFPAMALGLHDIHGTQLFEAEYLVLNRQLFPMDFTLGLGRGRLKGPIDLWDEVGLFGGIEVALTDRIHLLAEYNPIEYEDDKTSARGVPEGADRPVNLGMRMKLYPGLDLGLSFQRGDTFGFMLHAQAELGQPLIPKGPDPPYWPTVASTATGHTHFQEMTDRIYDTLCEAGFQDVIVSAKDKALVAQFENNQYLSNAKAAGRVLRILLFYAPADIQNLSVVIRRRRIPVVKISVGSRQLKAFLFGEITEEAFSAHIEIKIVSDSSASEFRSLLEKENKKPHHNLGVKPSLDTYFNDPSGALKARTGIKPYLGATLWRGASVYARYDVPFYSNISSSNDPLPDAVRSDSFLYLDRDYSFDRLLMDQVVRLSDRTFGRISLGYLESMYAGVGGEILTFLGQGDLALGLEADWVKKREAGTQFDLLDFKTHSILGNAYYRVPLKKITLRVQYGRFLAGDLGWMFHVGREFATGAKVGFWYSDTDTDDLIGFNKGYHSKGVFVSLPARMFLPHDSPVRYDYTFVPWTRDVAATVFHWSDLFQFGADLMPGEFKRNVGHMRE
jgi:hypothetical protein